MSINLKDEQIVTFHDLAGGLPRRRGGRPVHTGTVFRWRSRGLKGIKLEAIRIGGTWYTSVQAFARFTARLTAQAEAADITVPGSSRRPEHDAADTTLQRDKW